MPRQLIRLREVRRSDSFDDQKTSAQIQGVEASAVTDQDVLEAVLSQIRRMLGTADWKDTPLATLAQLSGMRLRLPADCAASDAVGDLVHIAGPTSEGRFQITRADISDPGKMPAIGVLVAKSAATECDVQWTGEVAGVYTGLIPGRVCFVGPDGRPTASVPTVSGNLVQRIGVALAADVLLLAPSLDLVRRA